MHIAMRSRLAQAVVAAGLFLAPGSAHAAGGAFAVDDAEVDEPGKCAVEAWTSFATNRDWAATVAPSCVVNLGVPVEFTAQAQRTRSDDAWGTGGGLSAKVNLIPVEGRPFGLALSAGNNWDLTSGGHSDSFVNVPVTIQLHESFRINVNGGWQYDATTRINYLTWGAGFVWNLAKPLALIGEFYGQSGKLPPVGDDEAPAPNSLRQPRTQLGLRLTPKDNIDLDLIWGRNLTGENAHWLTLGVNLRF